jgi:hypothetical protein
MSKRHEAIGLKQVIRYEWMDKTCNLLFAGLDPKAARRELHEFLAERKGGGSEGERGDTSRSQVVNILMRIWVSPDPELVSFRNEALAYLREHPSMALVIQWAMISAAYPFWFNIAKQIGRVLNLQDQITQAQIFSRMKEQYGDRETVTRFARSVIRSFVAWGVLKDSEAKGCYEKATPLIITDQNLAILMCEAALHAAPEGKGALGTLQNHPAFFPFHLPVVRGDSISLRTDRIDVIRYGLDDELLKLKNM